MKKLTAKERRRVKTLLSHLHSGDWKSLDIKKLKGREDIFRARKGNIRIIYRIKDREIYFGAKRRNKLVYILKIERRGESTYRF